MHLLTQIKKYLLKLRPILQVSAQEERCSVLSSPDIVREVTLSPSDDGCRSVLAICSSMVDFQRTGSTFGQPQGKFHTNKSGDEDTSDEDWATVDVPPFRAAFCC